MPAHCGLPPPALFLYYNNMNLFTFENTPGVHRNITIGKTLSGDPDFSFQVKDLSFPSGLDMHMAAYSIQGWAESAPFCGGEVNMCFLAECESSCWKGTLKPTQFNFWPYVRNISIIHFFSKVY
jgi:hypothetical protein